MKKAKITLKILTPMFSYADKETVEFRITELKSLMRNTFRELYYFENINDMKEKEKKLFGNTEEKSPISFRFDQNINIYESGKNKAAMLPHKTNERDKCKIRYIKSLSKIKFYLICSDKKDDLDIDFYIELLIQASIIGAMGKRSRKGFGSFRICQIETDEERDENNKLTDLLGKNPINILKSKVEHTAYRIRDNEEKNNQQQKNSKSLEFKNYDAKTDLDYPYIKKISAIEIPNDSDYSRLIRSISQLTHDRLGSDFIENNNINKNILGNYKRERNEIKAIDRFACPVCVSFWENSNNKYMIIKELNYNYIFDKLNINERYKKQANKDYVDKYVSELIKIGEGKRE